jgi:hypothetical protein
MLLALLSLHTEDSHWRLEPPMRLLRTRLRSLLADGARIGGCSSSSSEQHRRRHDRQQHVEERQREGYATGHQPRKHLSALSGLIIPSQKGTSIDARSTELMKTTQLTATARTWKAPSGVPSQPPNPAAA